MSKMIKVWVGKGVLWHGRKKIGAGQEIPSDLSADALKSLTAKGSIKEVAASESGADTAEAEAKAKALNEAEAAAKEAEAKAKALDIGKLTKAVQEATKAHGEAISAGTAVIETLTKAVQTAKGANTKAKKAADADKDNKDLAIKVLEAADGVVAAEAVLSDAGKDDDAVSEAATAVTAAEAELGDANTLAETAVRLRMEADKLANG